MAKKATKKTAEELWELVGDVVDDYSTRDTNLDDLEDYYFLEGDKDADEKAEEEGIEVVHGPHGTNAVDLVQDLIAGAGLSVTVPARSESQADKRLADDAEIFLRALVREGQRAAGQGILERTAWLAAMRGCLAGRAIPVKSRIKETEEGYSQTDRLPILLQVRDPRYVYPYFGMDGLVYVVEQQDRTVGNIRKTYGADILPGKKSSEEVTWTEYWDDRVCCYWAAGEAVKAEFLGKASVGPWPHQLGGCPYVYQFARQTGRLEPEKRARPLLAAATGDIDRIDLLDSMGMTFVKRYNGDAWVVEVENQDFDLATRPGDVNYIRPGEKINPLYGGRQPLEVEKERAKYDGSFQRATLSYSMYGQDPGRMLAGYALNTLNQSGQIRLRCIVECVEQFMAELLGRALMVAETWAAPLTGKVDVFSVGTSEKGGASRKVRQKTSFDAAALKGYWHVETSLGELMPADQQANVVLATRVRTPGPDKRPLLSWETAVDTYKLTGSPADERMRIDREMALADPEVQELIAAVNKAAVMKELEAELTRLDVDAAAILRSVAAAKVQGQVGQGDGVSGGGGAGAPPPAGGPPPQAGGAGIPGQMLAPGMQGQLMPGAEGGLPPELANMPPEMLANLMQQMGGAGGSGL